MNWLEYNGHRIKAKKCQLINVKEIDNLEVAFSEFYEAPFELYLSVCLSLYLPACLPIYSSIPLLDLGRFFQFLDLLHSR
jgi:hypothetical protein